jgi:low temperature requirement protein LtrA
MMWWIYFGRVSERAEHTIDAMTGDRRTTTATFGTYLHFGIVAGILLASLGLGGAIENIGGGHPPAAFAWIALGIGLALFLAATAAYSGIARNNPTARDAGKHHDKRRTGSKLV